MEIINTNQPDFMARLKPILERGKLGFRTVEDQVKEIIARVRERGDEALLEYTRRFDKLTLLPSELAVTPAEIEAARQEVSSEQLDALKLAAERIRNYHQRQVRQSWFMNEEEGVILGQLIRPLERVGVYVPGGKAVYPSSVLMNVIPAQVAGVGDIIICSPANCCSTSRATAWAKDSLGVSRIPQANSSCSAWESKSAAMNEARALSSAITRISLGPATISIPTSP